MDSFEFRSPLFARSQVLYSGNRLNGNSPYNLAREARDRVMDDEESLDKVSVKDLALSYGIATDKQRSIHGEGTVVSHEVKVTLEDARAAIDEAKASVAKAAKEKVIDV